MTSGGPAGSYPQLERHEAELVDLAVKHSKEAPVLSSKESQILELYDRIHEQELESALLSQDYEEPTSVDDVEEQLAQAERELLEARATYSVRRKAVEAVLMTDPALQAIHSTSNAPLERMLLPLLNRRDALSLIHENLARAHASNLQALTNAEIENIQTNKKNQELSHELLELTRDEQPWRDELTDPKLKEQLDALEKGTRAKKADYATMKRIVSAAIVASGIDWARDEKLCDLVVDDPEDDT